MYMLIANKHYEALERRARLALTRQINRRSRALYDSFCESAVFVTMISGRFGRYLKRYDQIWL